MQTYIMKECIVKYWEMNREKEMWYGDFCRSSDERTAGKI